MLTRGLVHWLWVGNLGTFSGKTKDKVTQVHFTAALPSPAIFLLFLFFSFLIFGSGLLLTHLS